MPTPPDGSRTSAEAAGWDAEGNVRTEETGANPGSWEPLLRERESPKWDSFSWLTVRALFESVNDLFAKFRPEIVDERRARWIAAQRARGAAANDFVIPLPGSESSRAGERSFLLVGDTGEQDGSQYAVAPYLTSDTIEAGPAGDGPEPEFLTIVSDVIYPAGDVNEYVNGFYIPYREFEKPIYALPGNHDWYDGLDGFMYHFCGAEPLPVERFRKTDIRPGTRLASVLWRGSEAPERERVSRWRDSRHWGRDATKAVQPAPYFAIDLGDLMLVSIDTGVTGAIDDEQGRWLERVSEAPKQKILLTGKPLYVDGAYHPGEIAWKTTKRPEEGEGAPRRFATVDDMVRHEEFGYVAAIGGDVHNYQRYPIRIEGREEPLYYLVSGGGGAYLSATHRIGPLKEKPLGGAPWPKSGLSMPRDEDVHPPSAPSGSPDGKPVPNGDVTDTFHCYPQRGDSLKYTARRAGPRMFNAVQLAAAAFVASASMLLHAAPLHGTGVFALLGAFLPLVASGLILGALDNKIGLKELSPHVRHGMVAIPFFVLTVFGLTVWGLEAVSSADLLDSGRFWGMIGVALAIPALVVGAILWAHDLRGSLPASLPQLALVGALAASLPIFHPLGAHWSAPQWLLTVVVVGVAVTLGTIALGAARSRWLVKKGPRAYRVLDSLLIAAAPIVLAVALALNTDSDRVPWLAAALAFAGGWPFLFAQVFTDVPTREEGVELSGIELVIAKARSAASFLATAAWITVAALLLHLIGDGWVTIAAIGSVAVLVAVLVLAAMLALAHFVAIHRFYLALALALAMFAARLLPAPVYMLLAIAFLLVALLSVKALAAGKLNANAAQTRIRSILNGNGRDAAPVDDGRPRFRAGLDKDEMALFKLLYPYSWSGDKAEGAGQTGAIAQAVAKMIAELSDSDEPPFFKNLLRVDLRPRSAGDGEPDRELTISCFGVTGFATEEASGPPLEDQVTIRFRSQAGFAEWLAERGAQSTSG